MKTDIHNIDFPLKPVSKERPRGTRKWPIIKLFSFKRLPPSYLVIARVKSISQVGHYAMQLGKDKVQTENVTNSSPRVSSSTICRFSALFDQKIASYPGH